MKFTRKRERGFSLLEVLIASVILMIVSVGVLGLFSLAILQNTAAGDHGTRVTEYAQDKMEQLMALQYSDTVSDPTQYPTQSTGGVGLSNGGSLDWANPVNGYVDYIDGNGNPPPTATAANAAYIREWLVADDSTHTPAQWKTITVQVKKIDEINKMSVKTTLICQKTSN